MMRALFWLAAIALTAPVSATASETGEQSRSYTFAATGEAIRYRVYVPTRYDPSTPLPLVVVLHGGGSDENRPFEESGLQAIAEARGYIVLAPRGYSPFGGYGNFYPVVVSKATAARGKDFHKRAATQNASSPGNPSVEGVVKPPAAIDDYYEQPASQLTDPIIAELSEQEVFTAIADLRQHYSVDPRRLYLMGNSAGGVGTLYLAAKYPKLFAAVSPSGGAIAAWSYPWWRLREAKLPVLFVHADKDENANPHWSEVLYQAAKRDRADAHFLLVNNGNHSRGWTKVLPQVFDFFAAHVRRDPAQLP